MDIGKEMFDNALELLNHRYDNTSAGGAAVLRTDSGEYLTSVWADSPNESALLCAEVGAICEVQLPYNKWHQLFVLTKKSNFVLLYNDSKKLPLEQ